MNLFERFDDEVPVDVVALAPERRAFRFAGTFILDMSLTVVCCVLASVVLRDIPESIAAFAGVGLLGLVIAACYVGKVLVVSYLDNRGGDARTYVLSSSLVDSGPYAVSRNPTYLLALVQFLAWAAMFFWVQSFTSFNALICVIALAVPVVFYAVNEIKIMPSEEATLRRLHGAAFDAYAAKVSRWFGWSRAAQA